MLLGDCHTKNVAVNLDTERLCMVDWDLAEPGPRAADLAFFFWHWGWNGTGGDTAAGYPSLVVRRAVVAGYFTQIGYPTDEQSIDEMLFDVEFEVVRVALGRAAHDKTRFDPGRVLPRMPELFAKADQGDSSLKQQIVEFGAVYGAFLNMF